MCLRVFKSTSEVGKKRKRVQCGQMGVKRSANHKGMVGFGKRRGVTVHSDLKLREGESSVVSPERVAGDGRIMTEGGGRLTSDDLSLDLAAGKS